MTATTPTPEQATTTTGHDEQPRPLVVDSRDALYAIKGLQDTLGAHSIWAIEEDDEALAAFATGAVGLGRLATALYEHRTRPLPASSGRTPVAETVGALRAQIAVVLSELDMPDPDVMLTYETMYGFTWGLQEAVKACELPPEENVDDEAYQKAASPRQAGPGALRGGGDDSCAYQPTHQRPEQGTGELPLPSLQPRRR